MELCTHIFLGWLPSSTEKVKNEILIGNSSLLRGFTLYIPISKKLSKLTFLSITEVVGGGGDGSVMFVYDIPLYVGKMAKMHHISEGKKAH